MKTKLLILGSGSSVGIPRIDGFWGKCNKKVKKNIRTRCSAIIIKGSNSVLIDTSPDLKYQLLSNNIKNISSILFTHEHADQTNGLFELRPFYWKNKKVINAYGDSFTINLLKKRQSYLFKNSSSYPAIVKSNKINSNFTLGNGNEKINFKTFTVKHGKAKVVAYVFEKTAYISDCNDMSIINIRDLKNLNFLVIDCLKYSKHPSHFNLGQCLYIRQVLKPKKMVLTNLSDDMDYNYLLKKLPNGVVPAYDGMKINL